MSSEQPPKKQFHEPENPGRRRFLKAGAMLAATAFVPKFAQAETSGGSAEIGGVDSNYEQKQSPEFVRGMHELREKARHEKREFFAIYREVGGVGRWEMTEEHEVSGSIDIETLKAFADGADTPKIHCVHTHPESQVGKGLAPPSFLDIQGVVQARFFLEGSDISITHQAVDATGAWTFELNPTSRFAVAMRYLQTKIPEFAKKISQDTTFKRMSDEGLLNGKDPRVDSQTFLANADMLDLRTRWAVRNMGKLEETLLGDFDLENFDRETLSLAHRPFPNEKDRFEALSKHYQKIGVTLTYKPFDE